MHSTSCVCLPIYVARQADGFSAGEEQAVPTATASTVTCDVIQFMLHTPYVMVMC